MIMPFVVEGGLSAAIEHLTVKMKGNRYSWVMLTRLVPKFHIRYGVWKLTKPAYAFSTINYDFTFCS